MNLSSARYALVVILFGVLSLGMQRQCISREAVPIEPAYPILRDIQYGFTFKNTTNRLLKEAELWTYAPVKATSTQKCLKLEASDPYEIIVDDLGNQMLHFRIENLAPYAVKPITIRAHLALSDTPNPISIGDSWLFLQSEKYIESDHPEIRQFAGQFVSSTPRETAEKTFRWVAGNIRFAGYTKESMGALYALKNRYGDCTEYMSLFTALCRANNIPARGLGGYVLKENSILDPGAYHNWAEFYEGGAWNISDPQRQVYMKHSSQYIAMQIMGVSSKNPMGDSNRFRFQGEGVEVKMTISGGPEGI
jgi:transglutaminase-like putative cysteine protease